MVDRIGKDERRAKRKIRKSLQTSFERLKKESDESWLEKVRKGVRDKKRSKKYKLKTHKATAKQFRNYRNSRRKKFEDEMQKISWLAIEKHLDV